MVSDENQFKLSVLFGSRAVPLLALDSSSNARPCNLEATRDLLPIFFIFRALDVLSLSSSRMVPRISYWHLIKLEIPWWNKKRWSMVQALLGRDKKTTIEVPLCNFI